ncbi:MAG: OmpH family outer membrane protein [Deltaproteobacteria bacterium]|nr:OmpH family outer membrane protein [Deltaproteobacteria bacterium]
MKKKIFIFFFLLLTFLFANFTQLNAGGIKLGYVNLKKVVVKSLPGIKAKEEITREMNKINKKLEEMRKEIDQLQNLIDKQRNVLSPEALREKEKLYQLKAKNYKRFYQDSQDELHSKELDKISEIQKDALKVIREIAKREGYTFIFEVKDFIYGIKALDITDQAIKELNKYYKKKQAGKK